MLLKPIRWSMLLLSLALLGTMTVAGAAAPGFAKEKPNGRSVQTGIEVLLDNPELVKGKKWG